jgi:hypothetical protein
VTQPRLNRGRSRLGGLVGENAGVELDGAWQRALEQAWQSFLAGTTPVGAVVADSLGEIVAEGRGRRYEDAAGGRQLTYCHIAHAEINALALLPPVRHYEDLRPQDLPHRQAAWWPGLHAHPAAWREDDPVPQRPVSPYHVGDGAFAPLLVSSRATAETGQNGANAERKAAGGKAHARDGLQVPVLPWRDQTPRNGGSSPGSGVVKHRTGCQARHSGARTGRPRAGAGSRVWHVRTALAYPPPMATRHRFHGDPARFEVVARFIADRFPDARYIADVAGGQGMLTRILRKRYGFEAEVIDPRGWTLTGVPARAELYTPAMADYYHLVVGLHPDQALRDVVESAGKVAVLVVPCCFNRICLPGCCRQSGGHHVLDVLRVLRRGHVNSYQRVHHVRPNVASKATRASAMIIQSRLAASKLTR